VTAGASPAGASPAGARAGDDEDQPAPRPVPEPAIAPADRESRRRVSSGGPWEASVGYSRAVLVGDRCLVSGTTDAGPDGASAHPGDPGAQARAAFAAVERALGAAGLQLRDVVRTRLYVTDRAHVPGILGVHGELFGEIRPAATLVIVSGLIDPSLLVEVEVEAVRGG
jgi:enamine deaminase RidA (YjgF/YER057c/UK114 family)